MPEIDRARLHQLIAQEQTTYERLHPTSRLLYDEATHLSLYDGTVEGFDLPELRASSVQFHPEAGPGPHDAWPILTSWVEEVSGLAKAA